MVNYHDVFNFSHTRVENVGTREENSHNLKVYKLVDAPNLLFWICVSVRFNSSLQKFFTRRSDKNVANGNAAAGSELEDGKDRLDCKWDDPSLPLLGPGKAKQTGFKNSDVIQVIIHNSMLLSPSVQVWGHLSSVCEQTQ